MRERLVPLRLVPSHQGRGFLLFSLPRGLQVPVRNSRPPRGAGRSLSLGGSGASIYSPSPLTGEGRGEGDQMPSRLTRPAKFLRQRSTEAERLFWSRVRAHRLGGFKFKRQQPVGAYVVDFVCFEAQLIVEIDGGQHAETPECDVERDRWLNGQGFRVLRFWNNEVLGNIDGVMARVVEFLSPSPPPSPIKGEGDDTRCSRIKGEGGYTRCPPIMGEGE